jgi:hypothetical protein
VKGSRGEEMTTSRILFVDDSSLEHCGTPFTLEACESALCCHSALLMDTSPNTATGWLVFPPSSLHVPLTNNPSLPIILVLGTTIDIDFDFDVWYRDKGVCRDRNRFR